MESISNARIKSFNKHAQSEVVSTVLLILLAIIAITIITAFAVPFVKDQLSKSDCLKVTGKIEIKNNPQYTCYNSSKNQMLVQVHIGDVADKIEGFSVEVGGSTTKSYYITNDFHDADVSMFGSAGVEIPGENQERTYIIANIQELPKIINIYPALKNGKTCDSSDSVNSIVNCFFP
jgi:hypothetical protein